MNTQPKTRNKYACVQSHASTIALLLSAGALVQAPAWAQDDGSAVASIADEAETRRLQSVTVTAQKREQNLQDVPVAVSAVPTEKLEAAGINSTTDLNVVVPGLNVTRQLSGLAPILRGVGNYNAAPGAEGAVATYIDGVYQPDAYGSVMALANIDRVEVLRGPQGTLFGRNATGGLIHVITRTPSHETSGEVSVAYGSQDTVEGKFYGTTGLAQNVAIDLGILYRDQGEGFGTNLATGNDAIYSDDLAIRSKMLIDVSDQSNLVIAADYAESESDLGTSRRPYEDTTTLFGTPAPSDFFDINRAADDNSENEQWGVSATYQHEFSNFDFRSILSYREFEAEVDVDQGEDPIPFLLVNLPLESETFTAEMQLKSNQDSWLDWIVGVYYFDGTAGVYPFGVSGPGLVGATAAAPGGPFSNQDLTNVQETQSYSVFGETVFDLSDRTRLTLGARYTVDQRDFTSDTTFTQVGTGAQIPTPTITLDEEFKEPSWRIVLDHTFGEDTLVYGSYSRGFKSGIFNTFSPAGDPVEAETLDAYEIGFKSEIFDNLVRFNGTAFFYEYQDLQLTTQRGGASVLRNAAEAETMGIEFELLAAVSEHLELNANVSVIETEFIDFPGAEITVSNPTLAACPGGTAPGTPNCVSFGNAAGNELPRAPKLTYTIGGSYERPVSIGTLGANLSLYYNDGFYNDFANRYGQDSYTLVNGTAYLTFGDEEQYRLLVYGKNLGDEEYYSYGTATAFGDYISAQFGRQYGVSLRYSF